MNSRSLSAGLLLLLVNASASAQSVRIEQGGAVSTIAEAVRIAEPGATVYVAPGTYAEHDLLIDKPLTLEGEGWPVLDGGGDAQIITITADDVTIRGFVLRNVSTSFVEDRSAVKVEKARRCLIENNRLQDTFFGIYLAETSDCTVRGNHIEGSVDNETRSGNGIHLWYCRNIDITGNTVRGHRDGIYLEFVEDSRIDDNLSEGNLRYGLHFMFSDRCAYRRNTLHDNDAGVAVMYTENVEMTGNLFSDNWGSSSFGLLLKDITDSRVAGNRFFGNTIGLYAEGSNRIEVTGNDFHQNGWAVKIMANADRNRFTANNFIGNTFDVATNSRQTSSFFSGNYWDAYDGYDLDRDGIGDVVYRPVRLFSLIVERNAPTLLLLKSLFVEVLEWVERFMPVLTPDALVDDAPRMRPRP